MEQKLTIRSVKNYIQEFGVDAIGKHHADPALVKEQILDAFSKEIFGQVSLLGDISLLAKDADAVDPELKRKADNILKNSLRKWSRLCVEFSKFKETYNLISSEDLMNYIDEIVDNQRNVVPDADLESIVVTSED